MPYATPTNSRRPEPQPRLKIFPHPPRLVVGLNCVDVAVC